MPKSYFNPSVERYQTVEEMISHGRRDKSQAFGPLSLPDIGWGLS